MIFVRFYKLLIASIRAVPTESRVLVCLSAIVSQLFFILSIILSMLCLLPDIVCQNKSLPNKKKHQVWRC